MLVRTNYLNHPLGFQVETPLLIPSFSSKGFSFKGNDESEAIDAFKVSKEFISEIVLVSAYDLHYNHFPYSEENIFTDITVIDSGGYETSEIYDLSATAKYSYPIKEWTIEKYEEILKNWPEYKAGIIVSYDHGMRRCLLQQQIGEAKSLFSRYDNFLTDFLIKPESDDQRYIQIKNIIDNINLLKTFSIIGVTEKELGNSILNRMTNLAKIRKALDDEKNFAPIHIFGSLDPITSILYFLAGAEIFDGLTWLKYSYFNGLASYQSNVGALHDQLGIHVRDSQIRSKSVVNNIYYLDKMKYIMKDFSISKQFKLFDQLHVGLGNFLEKSYNTFKSNSK